MKTKDNNSNNYTTILIDKKTYSKAKLLSVVLDKRISHLIRDFINETFEKNRDKIKNLSELE